MAITIITRASKGANIDATENDANLNNLAAAIENITTGHDHDGGDSKKVVAANVVNTPAGDIAAITVQAALNELDTEKAPKISPTLVTPALGTPASGVMTNCTSATPAVNDNSTKLATTAFIQTKFGVYDIHEIDELCSVD